MASHTVNRLLLAALLPVIALVNAPSSVWADDYQQPPPPPPPSGPAGTMPVTVPVYTAPLSQTVQTTYVPQSVALSGPEEITDVEEGRPAPDGYTAVLRTRKGLLIGGGVTLGVSYFYSALVAAIGSDISSGGQNEVAAMWIPVAGPFIQMASTDSATFKVFLAGLGAAQTTGAILLYYGLTTKKRVFVRNDLVGSMSLTPMAGAGASGLVLSGRF